MMPSKLDSFVVEVASVYFQNAFLDAAAGLADELAPKIILTGFVDFHGDDVAGA